MTRPEPLQPDASFVSPPAHSNVHTVPIISLTQSADPLQVAYVRHRLRIACQQPQSTVLCLFLGVPQFTLHSAECLIAPVCAA